MTSNRPPVIDEHGTEHRHGCHMPGWTSEPSRVRGYYILRCPTCGVVRITQARQPTKENDS